MLVKTLHGEIDVRKGLKPSFVFPRFTIRVSFYLLRYVIKKPPNKLNDDHIVLC